MFSNIVRGGQTLMHRVRMFWQVILASWKIGLLVAVLFCGGYTYKTVPNYVWVQVFSYARAKAAVSLSSISGSVPKQNFQLRNGRVIKTTAKRILRDVEVNHNLKFVVWQFKQGVRYGLFVWFLLFFGALVIWSFHGRGLKKNKHLRGTSLSGALVLKEQLKKKMGRLASMVALRWSKDKIALEKKSEVLGTLLVGTIGSGKTVALLEIMQQVWKKNGWFSWLAPTKGEKAFVYDVKGGFVEKFYREGKDILLNPLDTRFPNWNLWSECRDPQDFDNIAATLMPHHMSNSDPFWINSSRTIFSAACRQLQQRGCTDIRELLRQMFDDAGDEDRLVELLEGTEAAALVSKDIKQTALSIRATLTTYCKSLMYLPAFDESKKSFSIRDWIGNGDDSWLFLAVVDDRKFEALKPLISVWVDIALQSILSLPRNEDRRIYSFIDELPSLQRLSSIERVLSLGREYGSAFFTSVQDINQFRTGYGNQAESLLSLLNTTLFLRSNSPQSCEWMANVIGKREYSESKESRSYGANTIRDGVNVGHDKRLEHIVLPTELAQLNSLEGYLRVPGEFPVAKVSFEPVDIPCIAKDLIPRKINLRDFNLQGDGGSAVLDSSKVNAEAGVVVNDRAKDREEAVATGNLAIKEGVEKKDQGLTEDMDSQIEGLSELKNIDAQEESNSEGSVDNEQENTKNVIRDKRGRKPRSDKGKKRKAEKLDEPEAQKTVVGYVASPSFKKSDLKKTKVLAVRLAENTSCVSEDKTASQITTWYKLVFFDDLAEEGLKVIVKGCRLEATGEHKEVVDVDKKTGEEVIKHEIIVKTFKLLSSPKSEEKVPEKQSRAAKDFEASKDLKPEEYSYEEVALNANELERGR